MRTKEKNLAVNPFYSLNYKPSLSSFYATNHRLSPFHGDLIHQNCGGPGGLADSSGIVGGPALKRQPLAWCNGFVSTCSKTHVLPAIPLFPFRRTRVAVRKCPGPCLVGVEEEESNHQGEQAGGFGEGKAQNGVREKLTCNCQDLSACVPAATGR